jgi:hypothetical protein
MFQSIRPGHFFFPHKSGEAPELEDYGTKGNLVHSQGLRVYKGSTGLSRPELPAKL